MFGLIGKKLGMTQFFDEAGILVPVTAIEVEPNLISQIKTTAKDGYTALQLSVYDKKAKHSKKTEIGHFKKVNSPAKKEVREIPVDEATAQQYQAGQLITLDIFKDTKFVDVVGVTKGRGFQGVMKKFNFRGKRATHGTHENFRGPGSLGNRTYPGRIFKGKKMPGHMGDVSRTTQNLKLVAIIPEHNVLLVKGAFAGAENGIVMVKKAVKKQAKK